jgi:hypothetical protein
LSGWFALFDKEADNFDFEDLLGRECLLNVVHEEKNGNVYANIAAPHRFPRAWTPRRSSTRSG